MKIHNSSQTLFRQPELDNEKTVGTTIPTWHPDGPLKGGDGPLNYVNRCVGISWRREGKHNKMDRWHRRSGTPNGI